MTEPSHGTETTRLPTGAATIAAEFDGKAPRYENDRLAPWYKAQSDLVLGHLPPSASPFLDVGCGTGWLLRRIARQNRETTAIGVDLSPGMIREASRHARDEDLTNIELVLGDWEDPATADRVRSLIPTRAGTVVCVSALHYFREPVAALQRMRGLLGPGGRLLVVERSRDHSMLTKVWDLLHRRVIRDHVRFYHERELLDMMIAAGFPDVRLLERVRRYVWKGKLFTSLVLLEARPVE